MHEAAMRLTCPNCGATYALDGAAMPPGGSHVQCGECHTRWFARPEAPAPQQLSEDQILARLESRTARPRLAGGTEAGLPRQPAEPVAPVAPSDTDLRPGPAGDDAALAARATPGPHTAPDPEPAAPAASEPEAGPVTDAPQTVAPAAAPAEKAGARATAATPLRPRQAATRPVAAAPRPAERRQERVAPGFLAAVALAAAALAVYLFADAIERRAPAVAPALAAYVAGTDAARTWIEARLGPMRDALTGG